MSNLDKTLSSLPYARFIFGDSDVQRINNKFDIYAQPDLSREKKINALSVVSDYDHHIENTVNGGRIPNLYYHQLMYNSTSEDKTRRLKTYRTMSVYPEVKQAIREIANEFFTKDERGELIKGKLHNDYNEEVRTLIEQEFQSFLHLFKFKEKGNTLAFDFVTEGELFWENIVSAKKPEKGILGVSRIGADRIDPLYYDIDNELIDSFILRTKIMDEYPFQTGKYAYSSTRKNNTNQILFMNEQQVTYVHSGEWEASGRKFRVPPLAVAHGPYTQLSLIEDATVIYMLVRAPERLVFNIATGNMPPLKAEQYTRRMMAQFWSKKTISKTGQIENVYDGQGMTENYWFPKPANGEATTVDSIGGGAQTMGNLEILNYFVQKLYKSLQVPLTRLNSDTAFSDGEAILREELKFAMMIIELQKKWAEALKKTFIVHLKLKGRKLTELADRLKISNINVPIKDPAGKNAFNSMGVDQIYRDNFTDKCWDYYDIVQEAVTKAINEREEKNNRYITILENKKEAFLTEIEELVDQVLLESDASVIDGIRIKKELLVEEIENIDHVIEDYKREISDLREDNTSWWAQYELREEDFDVTFIPPSQFFGLREKQLLQMKIDSYNGLAADDAFSKTFLLKWLLGLTDNEILQNRSMSLNDAAFRHDLAQTEANGADWREKLQKEASGGMGDEMGGGDFGGGFGGGGPPAPGGGGEGPLPDFGTPSEGNDSGESNGSSDASSGGAPSSFIPTDNKSTET